MGELEWLPKLNTQIYFPQENEKHPLDDLKNDEITKKREKCEMHTEGPGIWREI